MTRSRLTSAILGVIAVPVLALGLTAASSQTPPVGHAPTVIVNCLGKVQVEPGTIVLACADYNSLIDKLTWTSWTPGLASGTGTLVQNDCIPYCAAGHFHKYPVLVVLWANKPYDGGQRYTEITEILPGARPPVFNGHTWVPAQRVETSQLWAPQI